MHVPTMPLMLLILLLVFLAKRHHSDAHDAPSRLADNHGPDAGESGLLVAGRTTTYF